MGLKFEDLRTELVKDFNALHASGAPSVVVKNTFLDNEIDFLNAASTEVSDTEAALVNSQNALVIAQAAADAALNGAVDVADKAGTHVTTTMVGTQRTIPTGYALVKDGQEINLGLLNAIVKIKINADGSIGVTLLGGLL